jgi:predicted metal-binding membrane protein
VLYCLGGCWALMLVVFAVGLGSLIWMIVLTMVMTAERVGRRFDALIVALTGFGLICAGVPAAIQPDRIG